MKENIPKILHFIWIDFKDELNNNPDIPNKYKKTIDTCRKINNNYEIKIWNGVQCLDLVSKYFPEKLEDYKKLKYPIQRCDWVRYMILYVYGGIYIDCDRICQYNFDGLPDADVILTKFRTRILNNDIIIAKKESDFLKNVINNLKQVNIGIHILDINFGGGIIFFSFRYYKYKGPDQIKVLGDELTPCNQRNCNNNIINSFSYSIYDNSWTDSFEKFWVFLYKYYIYIFIFILLAVIYYYKYVRKCPNS